MLKKNDLIKLKINDLTSEGMGVGRCDDGLVIFVAQAAPGDEVNAHILKVEKNYAYAKIESIITPSSIRQNADCSVFEQCGGCLFRHLSYPAELNIKKNWVIENFRRIGKIDIGNIEIFSAGDDRYRNKAQYPAGQNKDGSVCFGFFANHSHRVIPCAGCLLEPEINVRIIRAVENFCNKYKLSAYNEKNGKGLVRHLYIRHGKNTGEIMVALIVNAATLPHSTEFVQSLTSVSERIISIQLITNTKQSNVILGDKATVLYGKNCLTDVLCDLTFNISPFSFYQVNHDGAEILYSKAREYASLTGNETLIDLYCGTGTIGLSMADRLKKLIGIEIIPEAIENAKKNAAQNRLKNAEFICGDAGKAAKSLADQNVHPDIVVIDPPRKGCDPGIFDAISEMNPSRIVMISCNSATAARDAATFSALGYNINKVSAVDMFPRTGHVETVVLMSKR